MTDGERADLRRRAAAAYEAGDMRQSQLALDALGAKTFADALRELVDGAILNKHPGKP